MSNRDNSVIDAVIDPDKSWNANRRAAKAVGASKQRANKRIRSIKKKNASKEG